MKTVTLPTQAKTGLEWATCDLRKLSCVTSELRKERMLRFMRRGSQWIQVAVIALLTTACSSSGRQMPKSSPAAIEDKAFRLETAFIVSVNVPSESAEKVLRSITDSVPLEYGKYDRVAFRSATGVEQFRPLQGSRAGEQAVLSEVPTTRITFAIPEDVNLLQKVIAAARYAHPYEEPVVHVESGWMSRAKASSDESNPNRWWNQPQSQLEKGSAAR